MIEGLFTLFLWGSLTGLFFWLGGAVLWQLALDAGARAAALAEFKKQPLRVIGYFLLWLALTVFFMSLLLSAAHMPAPIQFQ